MSDKHHVIYMYAVKGKHERNSVAMPGAYSYLMVHQRHTNFCSRVENEHDRNPGGLERKT